MEAWSYSTVGGRDNTVGGKDGSMDSTVGGGKDGSMDSILGGMDNAVRWKNKK